MLPPRVAASIGPGMMAPEKPTTKAVPKIHACRKGRLNECMAGANMEPSHHENQAGNCRRFVRLLTPNPVDQATAATRRLAANIDNQLVDLVVFADLRVDPVLMPRNNDGLGGIAEF